MNIELTSEEMSFIGILLSKELEETRVEIHHANYGGFKEQLQQREKLLRDLIAKIRSTSV